MQHKDDAEKNTFQWITIAKGIGIFLVVVGHFHHESSPAYWLEIRKVIYAFHMPLFFILSGYLYMHGKYSYLSLMGNKIKRLLYPFTTIAVAFFLIKYIAAQFVHLQHPVGIDSVYSLFINPIHSYMPLLWFVHALFLIFAVYPLVRFFLNDYFLLLLFIAVAFVGQGCLLFGNAVGNMPFFVIGVILRENVRLSKIIVSADWFNIALSILVFVLIYTVRNFTVNMSMVIYLLKIILGFAGSLCVINISQAIVMMQSEKPKGILLPIGEYSMTIYLFHTLFESTVRVEFLQGFRNIQTPFEVIALIAILCGLFFPFELEKRILRKHAFTRRFVLGLTD